MRASVPALQKTTVRPPEPHTSSFCSCDICGPDCPCAEIGCYYDSGNGCKCCVKKSRCRIGGYKYDINAVDRKRKNILRDKEVSDAMRYKMMTNLDAPYAICKCTQTSHE